MSEKYKVVDLDVFKKDPLVGFIIDGKQYNLYDVPRKDMLETIRKMRTISGKEAKDLTPEEENLILEFVHKILKVPMEVLNDLGVIALNTLVAQMTQHLNEPMDPTVASS